MPSQGVDKKIKTSRQTSQFKSRRLQKVLLLLLGNVLLPISPEPGHLLGSSEDFCDILLDTVSDRGARWDSGDAW